MKTRFLPTLVLLLALSLPHLFAQTIIEVTNSRDEDEGPDSLLDLRNISLREAINHAPEGAIITLSNRRSLLPLTEGPLLIDKDLTIVAEISGRRKPIIQGDG